MAADIRRPLGALKREWENCTKCSLGVRRDSMQVPIMFGEGKPGRIMVVMGSPGRNEEWTGDRFSGDTNELLKGLLDGLDMHKHCYFTHVVSCRSCVPDIDPSTGMARLRKQNGMMLPVFNDAPPNAAQVDACHPRLMEEIYLVDPIVILALGSVAISALMGKQTSVGSVRGNPQHIEIPGAGSVARITEKKRAWGRKVGGVMQWPVDTSSVRYLMIPTFDPFYVKATENDLTNGSPGRLFAHDLRAAKELLELYASEVEISIQPQEEMKDEEHPYEEDDQD